MTRKFAAWWAAVCFAGAAALFAVEAVVGFWPLDVEAVLTAVVGGMYLGMYLGEVISQGGR